MQHRTFVEQFHFELINSRHATIHHKNKKRVTAGSILISSTIPDPSYNIIRLKPGGAQSAKKKSQTPP